MTNKDIDLADAIKEYYADILRLILFLYPWGQPGPLQHFSGPNAKQTRFLDDLSGEIQARRFNGRQSVKPILMSISSGHDTGKTGMMGMLAPALMVSRDGMRGTVTANTAQQLATKIWAEIQTWQKRSLCAHWFEITSERFYRVGRKSDWFIAPQSPDPSNAEAFAGQHAVTSSSVYIFEESSNIDGVIWETAMGGIMDGESMWFPVGNPTRGRGWFYDINFGKLRDWWNSHTLGRNRGTPEAAGTRIWDSRESEFSNKEHIADMATEWGEDSDLFRVRVKGLPPLQGDAQFISASLVHEAQRRVPAALIDDPLIAGCDLSWGGSDKNCVRFRRGCDARSIPPVYVPGELSRNPDVMTVRLAEILERTYAVGGWSGKVAMLFIDSAGICGPIVRRLRELGHKNIIEVNFGGHSPDAKYENARAFMWGNLRDELSRLAIDKNADLQADLQEPGYKLTKDTRILLEKKQDIIKRLGHSTDDGDSLALTYYAKVSSRGAKEQRERKRRDSQSSVVSAWS